MSKAKRHKKGFSEADDVLEIKKKRKPKTFKNHIKEKHFSNALKSKNLTALLDNIDDEFEDI